MATSRCPEAARFGRLPLGTLGAIGLIVVVEAWVAANPLNFGLFDMGDWSLAARAARVEAPGAKVLCFGDSMTKLGLQPAAIGPRLGEGVYNLAVSSGSSVTSYLLLERAIRAGARPRALIVDFHPHLMQTGPRWIARYWREILTPREAIRLASESRDPGLLASTMIEAAVPSIRGRYEIRDQIVGALGGVASRRPEIMLAFWRNWHRNRGGYAMAGNPAYKGDRAAEFAHLFAGGRGPDPVSASYARRFLRLAEAREIPVFLLIPPFAPEIESRRRAGGLSAEFDRLVATWQGRFPGVVVLDARESGYPTTVFADPIHLDHRGAATLSLDVADAVARRRDDPSDRSRVVRLPAYRDRSAEVSLEDGAASLAIVEASRRR